MAIVITDANGNVVPNPGNGGAITLLPGWSITGEDVNDIVVADENPDNLTTIGDTKTPFTIT